MNYSQLRETLWRNLGYQQTNQRPDYLLQEIRDNLNDTLREISEATPYLHYQVRETTLAVVSGTSTYTLDDWCKKPLAFWTEDENGHKVYMLSARELDRSGAKASGAVGGSAGPYQVTWYPISSASKSGASGASTGATVSEGATSITFGSSGTSFASTDTGKMIRLNGEDMDYTFTYVSAHAGTLDRAYRARVTGNGVSGAGSGAANVRWELSPAGRYRITLRPTPAANITLYYRYVRHHQRLLNDDDVPELPSEFLPVLTDGALARNTIFLEKNPNAAAAFLRRYKEGLGMIASRDVTDEDEEFQSYYESPIRTSGMGSPYNPGQYGRRFGYLGR